jgi:hypothetical protein
MNFQKLVLIIAIILLIVILIVIGILLSKASKDKEFNWPPIIGECPDYWVDMSGNGEACFNSHSLGRCNLPSEGNLNTMNFNQMPFTGENGLCSKFNWANTCRITWDGITSGVRNPCVK